MDDVDSEESAPQSTKRTKDDTYEDKVSVYKPIPSSPRNYLTAYWTSCALKISHTAQGSLKNEDADSEIDAS